MSKKYKLKKFSDFGEIPIERLPICLSEFCSGLIKTALIIERSKDRLEKDCSLKFLFPDEFVWIDDGKTNFGWDITLPDKTKIRVDEVNDETE